MNGYSSFLGISVSVNLYGLLQPKPSLWEPTVISKDQFLIVPLKDI